MRSHFLLRAALAFLSVTAAANATYAAKTTNHAEQVQAALTDLRSWVGPGANGDKWQRYLRLDELAAELAKGDQANPAAVNNVLAQFDSGAPGLQLAKFAATRKALENWQTQLYSGADLPQATRTAKEAFRPVTAAQVASARTALESALRRLESYLATGGANGQAWGRYLKLEDLRNQLAAESPDIETLRAIADQFDENYVGLEMPVFAQVRNALDQYINTLEAARTENLQTEYEQQLEGLGQALQQYAQQPTEPLATAIGNRLGWLERTRQAPALVRAIRRRYSYPNLYVYASEQLVGTGIAQPINEVAPLRDVILGTQIYGTTHTIGQVRVDLVPSPASAAIDTVLTGIAYSQSVGYNGPAIICSRSATQICGRKRMLFDARGLMGLPAVAEATTNTDILGVSANRGGLVGHVIEHVATKRAYQSKNEAEYIAGEHAEVRIRDRVEQEAESQIAEANVDFREKFRDPLLRRGQFPDILRASTTDNYLNLVALQAGRGQIGAPTAPPRVQNRPDLATQVHETFVNNSAAANLSGVTLTDEEIRDLIIKWRGSLPEQMKDPEEQDPWSITFAEERPVTVQFREDQVEITIRGQQYTSGEREFRAMDVTAIYNLETQGDVARLVRQGELQIVPPGFEPGKDRLSPQQISLRTILQRKFEKLFEPVIVGEGLVLPGDWARAGKLNLVQLDASRGWLVLGWNAPAGGATPQNRVAALDRQ